MTLILALIGGSAAIGFGAEHRYRASAERFARRLMWLVLWVLMPVVTFFNIATLHITARVGAGIAFGWVAVAAALVVAYLVGSRLLHADRPTVGALMNTSAFGNTGYLGIPLTGALLGLGQIPNAVAYDTLVSSLALVTVGFSVGAGFGTVGQRPRDRLAAFFLRNPPLWAAAFGLLAPAALAPHWAVHASRVLVIAILPIGFFAVGVTIAAETEDGASKFPPPLSREVVAAVALKLTVPPLVVLGLSALIISVPEAYVTQAAMASGLNNLVIAHSYGLNRRLTAAAIAWSTAVVALVGLVAALL
ncbi:MAG: malate permease [Thermoleophilaceae bacterium]|nr:malate permease [Thermoleophilaceae bacterium]